MTTVVHNNYLLTSNYSIKQPNNSFLAIINPRYMKRSHITKLKKPHIFLVAVLALAAYLIFAYNYFYFRLHSIKLDWPNNRHTYRFNEKASSNKTYVALGDSLTFGFGTDNYQDSYTYQVAQYLSQNGQGILLKDFSFPGYKSLDILQTVDAVIAYKPDIVTVFVGVNDTHKLVQSGDFTKNYNQILSRLSSETKARIYVINLPYLGAKSILLTPYNHYFDSKTRERNNTLRQLADKYRASYIDLYTPTVNRFKKDGPWYSKDLYHPSAQGYKIWAEIIENDIH